MILASLLVLAGSVSAKVSTNYRNAILLAYSPVNSVYEDDNIRLEIYDEALWATNKTKKPIFIDISRCFLVNNGASYPMWTESVDEKKASKGGTTTDIASYVTIAPATGDKQNATFICDMSQRLYGEYSSVGSPSEDFSEYDKRFLELVCDLVNESLTADPKIKSHIGTVTRHFTEDESISNIGASIAYAFDKKAENWSDAAISTWVSDAIFAPYYVDVPKKLSKNEKKGYGLKEIAPMVVHVKGDSPFEFDEDKSPIIACDWNGNFNKGTFKLSPIKIKAETNKDVKLGVFLMTGGIKSDRFKPLYETYYKTVLQFMGKDADWGKMSHTSSIKNTKQTK